MKLTDEQQAVVEAPVADILVSAAAGSGKTFVLVERILKRVLDESESVDIDEILIVTFTNDAAAQMRDRIRKAIDERLAADPDNQRLLRQSDRLHFANVMTLDSFCQSVVKRYFHVLNIDPAFRVLDETDKKLLWSRAVTETIEASHEKADGAFLSMLSMYAGGRNDEGLRTLITDLDTFAQSDPFPEDWIRNAAIRLSVIKDVKSLLESDYAESEYRILKNLFTANLPLIRETLALCNRPDGPYFYSDGVANDLDFCRGMAEAGSFTEMISQVEAYYGGKTAIGSRNKDPKVDLSLTDFVKKKRDAWKAAWDKQVKVYADPGQLAKEAEDQRQCAEAVKTLCELTIACRRAYRLLMDEKNAYDFSEIAHMTLEVLLKKEPDGTITYTDAAMQYRKAFREIMVDEYQDSNYVQEMFLKAVAGWKDGKPNLFMVGDIKQSIYKFRMAKPELFMEKYETFRTDPGSPERLIVLNRNFRSRETIVRGINRVFKRFMQKEVGGVAYDEKAELKFGAEYEVPFTKEEAAIEYILTEKDSVKDADSVMAAAVVKRVRELTDPISGLKVKDKAGCHTAGYRDIAILSKKSTALMNPVIEALLAAGIPAYAADMKGYFDCTEVRNVLNFLRILDNPYEDIPFHAVLKSPMGGFSYEDLALIAVYGRELSKDGRTDDAIELLRKLTEARFLTDRMLPVREKAAAFLRQYDALKIAATYLSVPELLAELYRLTGYLSYVSVMPAGTVRARNLNVLLEKAKAWSAGNETGLSDFVRYIDDMKKYDIKADGETGSGGDAIRVMTVHKSKGLEYPIIIVLDLERQLTFQEENPILRFHDELGIGAKAVYPEGRYRKKTFSSRAVENRNRMDERGEALRLLYVAMTRAKEKLILLGACKADEFENYKASVPKEGEPLGFDRVVSAKSYQDILLPVILGELSGEYADDWALTVLREEIPLKKAAAGIGEASEPAADDLAVLRDFFSYHYPYKTDNAPVKVSVSELKMSAMEEYEASHTVSIVPEEPEPEAVPVPKFVSDTPEAVNAGALRGTFYHRFLELHDYGRGESAAELRAEADELVTKGFVPKELPEELSFEKLSAFAVSPIGQRMKEAFKKGSLKLEQPFVMSVRADAVNPEYDPAETVLVQGIIDAMFSEPDGIVLLDYKTDRVSEADGEEVLKARYATQLRYYAEAIERGTGQKVKEMLIYSFALQKVIRL